MVLLLPNPLPSSARYSWLSRWAWLLLAWLATAPASTAPAAAVPAAAAGQPPPSLTLELGQGSEGSMAGGQSTVWLLSLADAAQVLLTVEQLGVDLVVEVRPAAGRGEDPPLLAVDSPVDRRGAELAMVELPAAGDYRIELHGRELGAPSGRYQISARELAPSAPLLPAWRQMTRAAANYHSGSAEALTASAAAYAAARQLFADRREPRLEAMAAYRAAVMLRLVDDRPAALAAATGSVEQWQGLGEGLRSADAWNEVGLNRWALGETEQARSAFHRALDLYRQHAERYGEGTALANLCLMDLVAGELRGGLECYDRALPVLAEVGAVELEGAGRISAGRAWDVLGELERARQSYRRALQLMETSASQRGQAQVLNNLAVLLQAGGDLDGALQSFDRSLQIFRQLGARRWQARVLNNLGFAYLELGEPRRSATYLRQALALWREVADRRGEIQTLSNLSRAQLEVGETQEALDQLQSALAGARLLEDSRAVGIALFELARATAQVAEGGSAQALELLDEALTQLAAAGERRTEAAALLDRGELLSQAGELGRATVDIERALALARDIGDRATEARGLVLAAQIERTAGRVGVARQHLEAAIEIIEGLRTRISHPQLRATFAGVQPQAYELLVDLTMAQHRLQPTAGHERTAFEIGERSRARGLSELLAETRTEPGAGIAAELLSRRRLLLERLSVRAERLLDARAPTAGFIDDQGQAEILRELELVEAEMRRQHPAFTELSRPRPLLVEDLQSLLARPVTVGTTSEQDGRQPPLLLAYGLGDARSFLWAVTETSFDSYELPPRPVLEAAVRQLHLGFSDPAPAARASETAAAAELSRQLLAPVADQLTGRRLVIVPDGALHYLPWAALPAPDAAGTAGRPLVESHAVVTLPAARVLASLRREGQERQPARKKLAVFADPVFSPADARLSVAAAEEDASVREPLPGSRPPGSSQPGSDQRGSDQPGSSQLGGVPAGGWERLHWTAIEGRAIAALVAEEQRWLATGVEASRGRLIDGELDHYQVVHLATHGVLDAENPALSGLMLSLVDSAGQRQRGFLQLADIYDLRLAADLVVLSGCRTALGREIRGEGLIGLTRGFLYAGAERVVASLWRVEDRATAELMTRFYTAMWRQGLDPPQALQAAQRSIRRERRWRDPYFWAGWVLVGDWQ